MNPRLRKLIGLVALMIFLLFYIGAAAWLGTRVPENGIWKFVYYAVIGTSWGLPVFPLISWMNRPE